LDERFEKACKIVLKCKGRVIFTGVGHSGHVGKNRRTPACTPKYGDRGWCKGCCDPQTAVRLQKCLRSFPR
jgi:hypothetical protein